MSRDRNLRKLKKNLNGTQSILGSLLHDVTDELESRLNKTKKVASKRIDSTTKQLDKTYQATSKDLQKKYNSTRKDVDKQLARTKSQAESRYMDARSQALVAGEDLKGKAAKLLAALAGGVIAARNKLTPDEQMSLSSGVNGKSVSKTGYFLRFLTIATILVSKRKKLMSLAQQLYAKVQDKGAREALTQEAREQYDIMRRLIRAYSAGQYREFPYKAIVKVVAAVLYFVSVADLIPDFIPILGFTDDLAILAWVYSSVKDDLQKFVDWESAEEKRKARLAGVSAANASTVKTTSKPTITTASTTTTSAKPATEKTSGTPASTGSTGTKDSGNSSASSTPTASNRMATPNLSAKSTDNERVNVTSSTASGSTSQSISGNVGGTLPGNTSNN